MPGTPRLLFSPVGWTAGVEAAAEAALKSAEESDIARRAAGAAVQTDGVQRRIVLLACAAGAPDPPRLSGA